MALMVVYGVPQGIDEDELVSLLNSLSEAMCDPFFGIRTIGDVVAQIPSNIVPDYKNCGLFIRVEGLILAEPLTFEVNVEDRLDSMIEGIRDVAVNFAADNLPACEWVEVLATTVMGVTRHTYAKVGQSATA